MGKDLKGKNLEKGLSSVPMARIKPGSLINLAITMRDRSRG